MAAGDYAILVGISRYADPAYPPLDGPVHDVDLVKKWLMSQSGGDVPEARIKTIVSPTGFPADQDALLAPPLPAQFEAAFLNIERERLGLDTARIADRLYLYFSGHGFCSRAIDRGAEAALYTANAARDYYQHIYGTYFARRAEAKALFREIVLVMDCCRDAEANRVPVVPALANTPDYDLAADVSVLQIYAVPRGGKAHERAIPERNGQVHGLLTHALCKTFAEARPTNGSLVSATGVRQHLKQIWEKVCGEDGAPSPHVYLPNHEIFFKAGNAGVRLIVSFGVTPPASATVSLRDGKLNRFAVLSASGNAQEDIIAANAPILQLEREGTKILLQMLPGLYAYEPQGIPGNAGNVKLETGEISVQL